MPNIRSAAKRVRQTKVRTARNRALRVEIRKQKREIIEHLAADKNEEAQESLRLFYKAVDKAAKGSVLHRNTASRLKSRAAALFAVAK